MNNCTFNRCKNHTLCISSKFKCQAYKLIEDMKLKQETDSIDNKLKELKRLEPTSDNPFFRLAIIGYEIQKAFGSLEHSIVYAERFKNDEKSRKSHLKNAQLELGDCFTQLQLLCETYGFDIYETRLLGVQHLKERHEDFKVKGWSEIGGTKQ